MPKLNSKGEWCAGVGGAGVSFEGQSLAGPGAGGGASWFDDNTVFYQNAISQLVLHNVRTGVIALAANRGGNTLAAGGGVWAAWLAGASGEPAYGLFSSTGVYLQAAGLMGVSRDGAIGIKGVYQGAGPYYGKEKDGSQWPIDMSTSSELFKLQMLGNQEAVWHDAGGEMHSTAGVPTPATEGWAYGLCMVQVQNVWWVMYASTINGGAYVAHPASNPSAPIVLHPEHTGQQFGFDAVAVGNKIVYVYSTSEGEAANTVVKDEINLDVVGGGGVGGGGSVGGSTAKLRSWGTFAVVDTTIAVKDVTLNVLPEFPIQQGRGRLVHPLFGPFDYNVKPDEWVNIDTDIIITPVWSSTRTLGGSVNVLWPGYVRDVVVEERWKSLGGLAMPIGQLRWMLMMWANPVDPEVGYVQWYPNYVSPLGYRVIMLSLSTGGQGVQFDDVVNYKDDRGPDGWMTAPVTLQMKIVDRMELP